MFSKLKETHFVPSTVRDLCHCSASAGTHSASVLNDSEEHVLTTSQENALLEFRDRLQEKGLLYGKFTSDTDLVRFLCARSFDVSKSVAMYETMCDWRKEIGADTIKLAFHFPEKEAVKALYPHFHHKTDKRGRPVYIERVGLLQLDEMLKITTMDRMLLYHVKEWEILIDWKFPACSRKAGRPIFQSLTILDLKGVTMKGMNKQVRTFIQRIAKIDQDYYPEFLGNMFVVNAPTSFKAIWAIIKPWLDKRTQKKIEVHGSSFISKLLEHVDAEDLPEVLGGTCRCAEGCENSDAGPWKDVPFALGQEAGPKAEGNDGELSAHVSSKPAS